MLKKLAKTLFSLKRLEIETQLFQDKLDKNIRRFR